jgi:hypothetical protein
MAQNTGKDTKLKDTNKSNRIEFFTSQTCTHLKTSQDSGEGMENRPVDNRG